MPEQRSALIDDLIEHASRRVFLDVGVRVDNAPGWTRMDNHPGPDVDVVHNAAVFPWPFDDASVFHIRAVRLLEHLPHLCVCCGDRLDPVLAVFEEFWRILLPGGTVQVVSGHSSNHLRTWTDPTICRAINEGTFAFANQAGRQSMSAGHYPMQSDFVLKWGFVHDAVGTLLDVQVELTKPKNNNGTA